VKRLLIFDLDGVLYRGDEVMPNAPETLRTLRAGGREIRYLTNNSTRTRTFFRDKLRRLGFDAETEEVMNSGYATRCWFERNATRDARLFIVGEEGLREELGMYTILPPAESARATHVVVGMDRAFNYGTLTDALVALQHGAELIATNRDPDFPETGGRIMPGGGAIVAAVETAAGRKGILIGKPEPHTVLELMRGAGATKDEVLMIGDRPATDIVAGGRAGVATCLVLTGVTGANDVEKLSPEERPDHVAADIRGVLQWA
jgi:phosphoglycolate/pyridoxal phosphate phosphatase family enzyme